MPDPPHLPEASLGSEECARSMLICCGNSCVGNGNNNQNGGNGQAASTAANPAAGASATSTAVEAGVTGGAAAGGVSRALSGSHYLKNHRSSLISYLCIRRRPTVVATLEEPASLPSRQPPSLLAMSILGLALTSLSDVCPRVSQTCLASV